MRYLFGEYQLDTRRWELQHAGQPVPVRPKVLQVLAYLLEHHERVVPKSELLESLWPHQTIGDASLLACIQEVRRAIGDNGHTPRLLRTVRGFGYRVVAAVTAQEDGPRAAPAGAAVPPLHATSPVGLPALAPAGVAVSLADGEYKLVTILCGALAEAPAFAAQLGPERWYRLLQTVVGLAQEVLHHYAGTFTLATNEGFTAVFGAPVAQEDHARQAVLAALELRQCVQDAPAVHAQLAGDVLTVAMGLHSGRVVVGGLGQEPQRLAAAVGAPLHMATRLQQLATPGTILLSAATYQLVQGEVRAAPCGTLDMAGQPTPVPIYTLQGLVQRQAGVVGRGWQDQSPFVGRERELALLHDHLAAAMTGQGQVVGLVGEPGMGKTRLLAEFCRQLGGHQGRVHEGRCLSYGQTTPYLPVRELLWQVCGLAMDDEPPGHTTAVQQWLHASGISTAEDMALVYQLLDLPMAPACLARLSPEERQGRTFALLRHLILDAAQQQPLVLVVENLHWIDPTSEAWLTSLVEQLRGVAVLLLGTYRPGYQPAWGMHTAVTQVALPPLHAQDSRTIVQAVLGSGTLPEARLEALVAQAGGNPFFVEELAWHALEQGPGDTPGVVPDTVQAVLAARLDRLPAAAKHLLQTASVIGTEVPVSVLQGIVDLPEATLQHGLTRLQAAAFLSEARLFPDQAFIFKHALLQEVAYGSLLQDRRQALHARIVMVLEGLTGVHRAAQVDRLAHHALCGKLWDKAVTYCRQAGDKALARSAYPEAVAAFEQTLGALQHLCESRTMCEQAIDLRIDLCFALWRLGDWHGALERLREAAALAERLGDQRRLAHVLSEMADGFRILGDHERALMAGQRALTLAIALGDTVLQVDANTQLGVIYYERGDYGRAIAALRQTAMARARHSQQKRNDRPDDMVVWPWTWLLMGLSQVGTFAEGYAMSAEVLRLAEAMAYPFCLAVATFGVGRLFLGQGDLSQAIEVFERGLALCQTHDLRDWLPTLAASVGYAYALAGRLPEALTLLDQAAGQYATMRGGPLDPTTVVWLGEAYLRAGRLDEAGTQAQNALAYSRAHQARGDAAYALQLLGEIAAQHTPPQAEQAAAHYRQALVLAEELGMRPLQAHCHRGLGMLYAATGRERARTELSTAIALYRVMEMTFWLSQAEAALTQVEG